MITINTMEDLIEHSSKLPTIILDDINNRITDWLSANGKLDDSYIRQQFKYAENFLNR